MAPSLRRDERAAPNIAVGAAQKSHQQFSERFMFIAMKPVHWNPHGYVKPAGHRATTGYPRDHGFGHEEWNASPVMRFVDRNGQAYRAFHTEPVAGAEKHRGDVLLFLYASHDGEQVLVGVAGRAIDLSGNSARRARLGKQLGLDILWKDVWAVPRARALFNNDRDRLRRHWAANLHHMPRWVCPETHFLWLDMPIALNAKALTAKSKFLTMFTRHTQIDSVMAYRLLNLVSPGSRGPSWRALVADLQDDSDRSAADDIAALASKRMSSTTRKALIDARLGQGVFRAAVTANWDDGCAVTGCRTRAALRASHIKPWSKSSNDERLDGSNGLLLVATLDALFDRYLITFDPDDGRLIAAPALSAHDRKTLPLSTQGLRRRPSAKERKYLVIHQSEFRSRHPLSG
jgi:HNH endonuclease